MCAEREFMSASKNTPNTVLKSILILIPFFRFIWKMSVHSNRIENLNKKKKTDKELKPWSLEINKQRAETLEVWSSSIQSWKQKPQRFFCVFFCILLGIVYVKNTLTLCM